MKNSFVIYTALFGDYDELLEPKEKYPECDFVCFTDQIDLTSSIWKVIIVKPNNLSSNILNRRYKWLPHLYLKEYEVSMYIDSSILVLNNPINLVHKYFYSSDRLIAISRHPDRNCIYDESIACLDYHKSKFFDTLKQMIFYKKSGFPKNFGLSANGVIIRKHNSAEIIKLMEDFWVEFNCWNSKRDQLSFYYIIWKNNYSIKLMDEYYDDGDYFNRISHKKKNKKALRFKNSIIVRKLYICFLNFYKKNL